MKEKNTKIAVGVLLTLTAFLGFAAIAKTAKKESVTLQAPIPAQSPRRQVLKLLPQVPPRRSLPKRLPLPKERQ